MQQSLIATLLLPSLLVVLSACSVEESFLDQQLFACGTPRECGEGWGCLRGAPYTQSFCAPRCGDADCDGTCTGGTEPMCLRKCLIPEDGSAGACQNDSYACIRTSVEHDDGVCYPVQHCETREQCGPGEVCLGEVLSMVNPGSMISLDNLYCVPAPNSSGVCPPGSAPSATGGPGSPVICVPECSVADPRCAPGFGCLTQLQQIAAYVEGLDGPRCTIGTYGLSCQDDTNCFQGSCTDSGSAQGSICTVSCDEASRLAGGCGNLVNPQTLNGLLYSMECDPTAPSEDSSGLCVVRYGINYPGCTQEPGSAYECNSGLDCVAFPGISGGLCTKSCTDDIECNEGYGTDPEYWPFDCVPEGICLFRDG